MTTPPPPPPIGVPTGARLLPADKARLRAERTGGSIEITQVLSPCGNYIVKLASPTRVYFDEVFVSSKIAQQLYDQVS